MNSLVYCYQSKMFELDLSFLSSFSELSQLSSKKKKSIAYRSVDEQQCSILCDMSCLAWRTSKLVAMRRKLEACHCSVRMWFQKSTQLTCMFHLHHFCMVISVFRKLWAKTWGCLPFASQIRTCQNVLLELIRHWGEWLNFTERVENEEEEKIRTNRPHWQHLPHAHQLRGKCMPHDNQLEAQPVPSVPWVLNVAILL